MFLPSHIITDDEEPSISTNLDNQWLQRLFVSKTEPMKVRRYMSITN